MGRFWVFAVLPLLIADIQTGRGTPGQEIPCKPDNEAVILCYHRIVEKPGKAYDISIEDFHKQCGYLADNNYRIIPLDFLVECIEKQQPFPGKAVVVTVDDGDISNYTVVYPYFRDRGWPVTIFPYTGIITGKGRSLSRSQIEEMSKNGVDVESHTRWHPMLTKKLAGENEKAYEKRIRKELSDSKKFLEEITGREVKYLAAPYGLCNRRVTAWAVESGYKAILLLGRGCNGINADLLRLSRMMIMRDTKFDTFKKILDRQWNRPVP